MHPHGWWTQLIHAEYILAVHLASKISTRLDYSAAEAGDQSPACTLFSLPVTSSNSCMRDQILHTLALHCLLTAG
ncbi:hypothetical protein V2G26_011791 [Clonostachys chloroleuca]